MSTFFINSPFTVTQNASLYAQNGLTATISSYDYILNINVTAAGFSGNQLFSYANYQQGLLNNGIVNTNSLNNVALNLAFNNTVLNTFLLGNYTNITSANSNVTNTFAYNTLNTANQQLPFRILEIVATKIFGSAKAQSAIYNDTDFYAPFTVANSMLNQIQNGINNVIQNTQMQLNIFNIYVGLDRIETQTTNNVNSTNDVTLPANFNFQNTIWDFPIFLQVNLFDASVVNGTAYSNLALLNNGPNVGGVQLASGSMNIPLLVRFYTTN
jgi:hypothetical protein